MNFVYLLVGMGVVAMCYYLLREEVTIKLQRLRVRLRERVDKMRSKVEEKRLAKKAAEQAALAAEVAAAERPKKPTGVLR